MARAATAAAARAPARSRTHAAPAPRRARPAPARPERARPRTRPAQQPGSPASRSALRFVERRAGVLLDRLLRGRLWVGCIGLLLAGIVFLNVSLLELNQEIAHTGARAGALDRQNSALRMRVASLDSSERVLRIAARRGMVFPPAGAYRYLSQRPWLDGLLAARRAAAPQSAGATSATSATSAASGTGTTPRQQGTAAATPSARSTYAPPTAASSPGAGQRSATPASPPTAAAAPHP